MQKSEIWGWRCEFSLSRVFQIQTSVPESSNSSIEASESLATGKQKDVLQKIIAIYLLYIHETLTELQY